MRLSDVMFWMPAHPSGLLRHGRTLSDAWPDFLGDQAHWGMSLNVQLCPQLRALLAHTWCSRCHAPTTDVRVQTDVRHLLLMYAFHAFKKHVVNHGGLQQDGHEHESCNIKITINYRERRTRKWAETEGGNKRNGEKQEPPVKFHAAHPASCGLIAKQP